MARAKYVKRTEEEKESEIKEMHETLVEESEKVRTSKDWIAVLDRAVRFHHYSFNNIMLAYSQLAKRGMEPPSILAGFHAWKDAGHPVRKGQAGLKIFAPVMAKFREGDPGYDPERPNRKRCVGFFVTRVWDAQQVEGTPDIEAPERLRLTHPLGEVIEGGWDALSGFAMDRGYSVSLVDSIPGGVDGDTRVDQSSIRVVKLGSAREFCTLAHELAHVALHCGTFDYRAERQRAEQEAESVAYIVTRYFGIDPGTESFHYLAGWRPDPSVENYVITSAPQIFSAAKSIIEYVEKRFSTEDGAK